MLAGSRGSRAGAGRNGAGGARVTKAQYIRWSNRREAAAQHFRDAIKEMRGTCEVSEASELTAIYGGVAEDCVTYAIGCAQGGIDLLISAMESMAKDVK